MSEAEVSARAPFRSRAEADAMAREFEASGLTRRAFCAARGLPLGTLDLYRKRLHREQPGATAQLPRVKPKPRWVKVESAAPPAVAAAIRVLCGERLRIEVLPGFDPATLRQVLDALRSQ